MRRAQHLSKKECGGGGRGGRGGGQSQHFLSSEHLNKQIRKGTSQQLGVSAKTSQQKFWRG